MNPLKNEARIRLREYEDLCRAKNHMDKALSVLTPEERLILQMLEVRPDKGNNHRLCELLGCEISTVYRRRNMALERFSKALFGA